MKKDSKTQFQTYIKKEHKLPIRTQNDLGEKSNKFEISNTDIILIAKLMVNIKRLNKRNSNYFEK